MAATTANIVQMTDAEGKKQYPVTSADAVGMPDGSGNLTRKIYSLENSLYDETPVDTTYTSGFINSDGTVTSSQYARHSDFVEIKAGYEYYVHTTSSSSHKIGYYSENNEGSFISAQGLRNASIPETVKLLIPDNAKYVRVTLSNADTNIFYSSMLLNVSEEFKGIQQQIDTVNKDVTDIEKSISSEVTEEVDTTYTSGFINSNGTVTSSQYARHSDFVEIKAGYEYYVHTTSSSSHKIGYYSENNEGSFISAQGLRNASIPETVKLLIPDNAKYVRVTLSNADTNIFYSNITKGLLNVSEELKVLQQQIDDISSNVIKEIYHIGENGDFAGIHEACAALKDNNNPKIIYIEGGEYDVYEEMGGQSFLDSIPDDVAATDWPLYSNFIPHNTEVIGLGQVYIYFLPENVPSSKQSVICPMSCRGAIHFENITIISQNCRYCIHDETGVGTTAANQFANIIKSYKNVYLYQKAGVYSIALGLGYQRNNTILIESCLFKSKNGCPVNIKDNSMANDNTSILISNSGMVSENDDFSVNLACTSGSQGLRNVTISNCSLKKISIQDDDTFQNNYAIKLIRCGDVEVVSDSGGGKGTVEIIN